MNSKGSISIKKIAKGLVSLWGVALILVALPSNSSAEGVANQKILVNVRPLGEPPLNPGTSSKWLAYDCAPIEGVCEVAFEPKTKRVEISLNGASYEAEVCDWEDFPWIVRFDPNTTKSIRWKLVSDAWVFVDPGIAFQDIRRWPGSGSDEGGDVFVNRKFDVAVVSWEQSFDRRAFRTSRYTIKVMRKSDNFTCNHGPMVVNRG